jgi:acetyl esterase/lipase
MTRPRHRTRRALTLTLILSLILTFGLSACASEALLEPLNWSASSTGIKRATDLAYGAESRQQLDIYAPIEARGAPILLFWHGGSWQSGDKDRYRFVGARLARQGFVVAVPNYRLAPANPFPAFMQDAALAVRWLSDHASEFGGDPARMYLSGHSAGGHIALILALDDRYLRAVGLTPSRLAGIVSIAGPTGLENLRGDGLKGVFPSDVPDRHFSPIALAPSTARTAAPFLLISGLDDDVIYASSVARLASAIRAGGGQASVRAYPGVGHLGLLLAFSDAFSAGGVIADDIAVFANLKTGP